MVLVGIASLIIAMGVTWIVTPVIERIAHALDMVDHPGVRKIHSQPIPRIGGVAVFIGFIAGLAFAASATGVLTAVEDVSVYWSGLAAATFGMMLLGLVDDIRGLGFRHKFAGQIVAATFVWYCGFRVETITAPFHGTVDIGWLSFPLTLLWIVGVTNAVNLIDGLDGLATGLALITTTAVALMAFVRNELGVTAASVALAGALIGFLRYNFNPARIFLGDSGSMFLGFVLAVISVRGSAKSTTALAMIVPLLVIGLPLMDTGFAVLRRLYRLNVDGGNSGNRVGYVMRNFHHVFLPDRQHIHHRLIDLGMSHRRAVLVLYAVGVLFAASAFGVVLVNSVLHAALILLALALQVAGFFFLMYVRGRPTAPEADGSAPEAPAADTTESPSSFVRPTSVRAQGH